MNDSLELAGRDDAEMSRGFSRTRIILVGARRDARKLLHQLGGPRRGMTIVGFVDAGHHQTSSPRFVAATWPSIRRPIPFPSSAGSTAWTSW